MQFLNRFDLKFLLLTTIVSSLLGCSGGRSGDRINAEGQPVTQLGAQAEIDIIDAEIRQRQTALFAGDYETHLERVLKITYGDERVVGT